MKTQIKTLKAINKKSNFYIPAKLEGGRVSFLHINNNVLYAFNVPNFEGRAFVDVNELIKALEVGFQSLEITESKVLINTGAGIVKLKKIEDTEGDLFFYPGFEQRKQIGFEYIHSDTLKELAPFMSKDDLRPQMCGIYFGNDHTVSTNGHYMKFINTDYTGTPFIMPSFVVNALKNNSDTYQVKYEEGYVTLWNLSEYIVFEAEPNKFPNYKSVIPQDNPYKLQINSKELINTVKTAVKFANKETKQITLNNVEGSNVVASECINSGTEYKSKPAGKFTGELERIGFNGAYLMEVAKNANSDSLNFSFSTPNRPAIINGDTLLMPVMLNNYQ